ncbi:MAG: class IV adenylate cyclase, partial [Candidatus Thorarchaeota archaeon]
ESFEVEVKVSIDDTGVIMKKLVDSGAKVLNSEVQIDMYFDHPCRTFTETDEAVRVRTRSPLNKQDLATSHAQNELTYKGPKIDKETKTRIEYTAGIDDTDQLTSILESLSFKSIAKVTKKRTFFDLRGITISIDDVEDVGLFLELEFIAHQKEEMETAKRIIFELLEELGIDKKQTIRDSYLEMYLEGRE